MSYLKALRCQSILLPSLFYTLRLSSTARFVGVISSPSLRHDDVPKRCRNHRFELQRAHDICRAYLFVDEIAPFFGSLYCSPFFSIQYVDSARCRATAPMAV